MRFSTFYENSSKPVISFEVFPPKTDDDFEKLKKLLPRLVSLKPSFMTVTYGAMGTTQARTREIAFLIKEEYGLPTASHLTCVGASRADLDVYLQELLDHGIHNIVALRGDPPKGETEFKPQADGLAHANELVAHIRAFEKKTGCERFGIAVAGYPEKHMEAADLNTDLANLKRKVDTGADAVITQLFYDNADYFAFVEQARAAGIVRPIVPGLMPILNGKQIQRITSMCGSKIPPQLLQDLEAAGDDTKACIEVGVKHCIAQVKELLERGAPGIHFYVLNRSSHIKSIMDAIG